MGNPPSVVVLAAGQGTRMKSARPKVLHPLCGRPMIAWVLDQAFALEPARVIVVVGSGAEEVRAAVSASHPDPRLVFAHQREQRGTGHAVAVAAEAFGPDDGPVVVLYGDMPLLTSQTIARLLAARSAAGEDAAGLLTAIVDDPRGFGRIVRASDGTVDRIVEERDADQATREIPEVNLGVYAFPRRPLLEGLRALQPANAQGELYLTDLIARFAAEGRTIVDLAVDDEEEAIGVNTLAHLAEARRALQMRILEEHLARGVEIEDPATTYIDHGVEIGAGTRILPCTVVRTGVRIGADCEIGPFTHLRSGTVLEDGAEVGNFTECKNSRIGAGSKAKHLSYLGDTEVGAGANIGAGTIFANYDGHTKHRSVVGDRAFVGSGTIVVAPNTIAAGAVTGAGAVITRGAKIGPGEVWLGVPARKHGSQSEEAAGGEGTSGGGTPAGTTQGRTR